MVGAAIALTRSREMGGAAHAHNLTLHQHISYAKEQTTLRATDGVGKNRDPMRRSAFDCPGTCHSLHPHSDFTEASENCTETLPGPH